jgi:hypothetical protein
MAAVLMGVSRSEDADRLVDSTCAGRRFPVRTRKRTIICPAAERAARKEGEVALQFWRSRMGLA